jgi:microsomal dipeptidase-like Zn-dependent dipeptidase
MLQIDKNRLDDELENQAQVMYEITGLITTVTMRMVRLKEELDKIEAEIYIQLRKQEGSKYTENEIRAEQQLDKKRISANLSYQESKRIHEKLTGLLEAWKARGFSLTTLANLAQANYYAPDSAGRDTDYKSNRETLSKARRRVLV